MFNFPKFSFIHMQFFLLQTCTVYYEKPIRATFKIIPVLVEIINENVLCKIRGIQ